MSAVWRCPLGIRGYPENGPISIAKDGKEHRYWSIVETRRVRGNRVIQRQVLYLGEINDSQHAPWSRTIEVFGDGQSRPQQMALFPEGRAGSTATGEAVEIRLGDLQLRPPVGVGLKFDCP